MSLCGAPHNDIVVHGSSLECCGAGLTRLRFDTTMSLRDDSLLLCQHGDLPRARYPILQRPATYTRSRCFETIPSSPMLHATLNRTSPISPRSYSARKILATSCRASARGRLCGCPAAADEGPRRLQRSSRRTAAPCVVFVCLIALQHPPRDSALGTFSECSIGPYTHKFG
jgi:hypothetical protein